MPVNNIFLIGVAAPNLPTNLTSELSTVNLYFSDICEVPNHILEIDLKVLRSTNTN